MSPASQPGPSLSGAFSVLLVEDEALIAAGLEGLLEEAGAGAIVWAPRAEEALRLIRTAETPFTVAVVDWLLGSVTAEAIVVALVAAGTPVLVYTGMPETVVLPSAGRVAVLGKPTRDSVVIAAVRRLLDDGRSISAGT